MQPNGVSGYAIVALKNSCISGLLTTEFSC